MRLHTDKLDGAAVATAVRLADAHAERLMQHGSRSGRRRAFEVVLSGDSARHGQGPNHAQTPFLAASWDQWGIVLATLYDTDPRMKAGPYKDAEHFHRVTGNRFKRDGVRSTADPRYHANHKWDYDHATSTQRCRCGARRGTAA